MMSVLYFANSIEKGILFATYSRYFESSMGAIMLAFGLVAMLDCLHNKRTHILAISSVVSVLLIYLFKYLIHYYHGVNGISNFQVGFLLFKVEGNYSYILSSLFVVTGITILILLRKSDLLIKVSYTLLCIMFLFTNVLIAEDASVRKGHYNDMMKISQDILEQIPSDENSVYFYSEDDFVDGIGPWWNTPIELQYLLFKKTNVKVVRDSKELTSDLSSKIVITVNRENMINKMNNIHSNLLYSYHNFIIWKLDE